MRRAGQRARPDWPAGYHRGWSAFVAARVIFLLLVAGHERRRAQQTQAEQESRQNPTERSIAGLKKVVILSSGRFRSFGCSRAAASFGVPGWASGAAFGAPGSIRFVWRDAERHVVRLIADQRVRLHRRMRLVAGEAIHRFRTLFRFDGSMTSLIGWFSIG